MIANLKGEWSGGSLLIKNKATGATVATISTSGIAAAIVGNVTGNVTGDVTGDVIGDVTGDVTGDLTGQTFGTATTYTADGAIALTDKLALLDGSSATVAATLAAGTAGQVIYVKAIDVTNAVTLVPASFQDGTTITFTPANEYAVLISDGTNWHFVGGDAAIT